MQNKNKLPRWRTKGVKATPNAEFGKLIETVLYIAENFFVLPIARQENFYVFWKPIRKKALNYEKNLHPHYNCVGLGFCCK